LTPKKALLSLQIGVFHPLLIEHSSETMAQQVWLVCLFLLKNQEVRETKKVLHE